MESYNVPKAEAQASRPVRYLHTASIALAFLASLIGVLTQVAEHFEKPKASKGARTKVDTALLGLSITKALPGIIKTARTLSADVKKAKKGE